MTDISLIKSYFNLFLSAMHNKHPRRFSYTIAHGWCHAMLIAAQKKTEPNDTALQKELSDLKTKLDDIFEKTNTKLNIPLPAIEFALNKNLEERGLDRKINIKDEDYTMYELHEHLEHALLEMIDIATAIAVKFSIDMATTDTSSITGATMDFNKT